MPRRIDILLHLAEPSNLDSILEHGLLSTEKLVDLAGIRGPQRTKLLRNHRPDAVQLPNGLVIRDQRPMPPEALGRALDDGLSTEDWYALLNRFVFLWPDRERLERQRGACGKRPQLVLAFNANVVLERFASDAFVCPINSGNARRKPARRGRSTFVPYQRWIESGWPNERKGPVAEVLFRCVIPTRKPYLITIDTV